MPYAWVEPEIALEYNGVKIYFVYRDDKFSNETRTFWYGYSIFSDDQADFLPMAKARGFLGAAHAA